MRAVVFFLALVACARPAPPVAPPELASFEAPADARSWYLQALYAESKGDVVRARRAMDWAVRLDRPNPWLWLAAARFAERAGDPDRALADVLAALDRAPDLPEAHLVAGRILWAAGRADEALAHLARAPSCDVAAAFVDATDPRLADVVAAARSACSDPIGDDPADVVPPTDR